MLLYRMTLVPFGLFRENLGNMREFLGKLFTAPPGQKLPVRLSVVLIQEN